MVCVAGRGGWARRDGLASEGEMASECEEMVALAGWCARWPVGDDAERLRLRWALFADAELLALRSACGRSGGAHGPVTAALYREVCAAIDGRASLRRVGGAS